MPAEAAKVLTTPGFLWLLLPKLKEEWLKVGSMPLAMVAFDEATLYSALNTTIVTGVGSIQ